MSAHLEFVTPPAPAGYSPAVSAAPGCRLVWVSGQLPFGPDGTIVAPGDWELQTRQTFQNVGAALAAAGAGWSDVVKLNIYVLDTSAVPVVRNVRDEFVDTTRPPASTLVQVAGLAIPGPLLEVEAVAAVAPR